jgi:hypothetical protein
MSLEILAGLAHTRHIYQPQRGDFSRFNIGRQQSSSADENLHHDDHRMSGIQLQAIELPDKLQQP